MLDGRLAENKLQHGREEKTQKGASGREEYEKETYNWRHMPQGDAGYVSWCTELILGLLVSAPGGLISVATARALNFI